MLSRRNDLRPSSLAMMRGLGHLFRPLHQLHASRRSDPSWRCGTERSGTDKQVAAKRNSAGLMAVEVAEMVEVVGLYLSASCSLLA